MAHDLRVFNTNLRDIATSQWNVFDGRANNIAFCHWDNVRLTNECVVNGRSIIIDDHVDLKT